jgi:hypothetical protein
MEISKSPHHKKQGETGMSWKSKVVVVALALSTVFTGAANAALRQMDPVAATHKGTLLENGYINPVVQGPASGCSAEDKDTRAFLAKDPDGNAKRGIICTAADGRPRIIANQF